jgi:hypothetical protein
MANPCKITFKKTKDGKAKEYTYAEFMTALQDGLFQELVDSGVLNANKIPGSPFETKAPEAPKTTKKQTKEKKSTMSDFMKSRLGEAYGDVKTRAYGRRVAQQRGLKVDEYISVDQRAMDNLATEKFDILKDRYEADEKNIFNDVLAAYLKTTEQEKIDNPGLSYQYQVMLTKIATYFYIKGDKKNSTKFYQAKAETATEAGKTSAALSAMSTPEELMNRILEEDESRDSFLNQVTSGQMTIGEAITQLREIAKITKDEADAIVTSAMPKVKKTATVVTVKPEFKTQRTASVAAIKDILSKKRAPGPLALSNSVIAEITPHVIDIARSYIQEGAYSAKMIKSKVWSHIKNALPGERAAIDQIVDDNMAAFDSEIKKNKEASVIKRLAKAFEGVIDETGVKKRALKILSDTILSNDPGYIMAKSRGEKVKAKDRLKAILNNKPQIETLVLQAANIAKANVDANESADAATKMAIKNEIDALVSDLLEMPIGNVERRAAASSMTKEELNAEIARIATEHFTNQNAEIQTLAETLVNNLGVDPAYATQLQAEIEPMIEGRVNDKMKANKAKIDTIMQGIKDAESVKKGVIKAIAKGQVSDTQFEDALLKTLGYKGISQADIATLKNYFNRLQQLQPGEELYQEINRYINDILSEYDETTAALIGRWFTEQFYINALSDVFKTAVMASGVGAIVSSIQHGAFTFLYNPARMMRAIKFAKKMSSEGATMGWDTVVAKWQKPESRFGETTLLEKPEEKAHGAVVRVTKKEYAQILDDIIKAKGGRKGYYAAQAALKTASHVMGAGKRKRKYMPAFSEISMVMMSAQDIIMGGTLQDIYTYVEAENYLDLINKESGVKMKKGSAAWNQQLKELLQVGPEQINNLKQEVAKEAADRIAMGESLPKGWSNRRLRDKIHNAMPKQVVDEMAHQAKKSLFLQKPETAIGAPIFNFLTSKMTIKDSDSAAVASLRTIGNLVMGFARLSIVSTEYAYKALPIVPAVIGIAYGKKIRYIDGKPTVENMTNEEKITRILKNVAVTAAWAGLVASMFDYDDEDDEITLNPNAWIKFYGSADDGKQKAEMEVEGAEPNSVTIFGLNVSLSLLGFGAGSIGKILGEVSNDVRFGKEDKTTLSINKVVGLVASQLTGSEMSSPKRALEKVFGGFGEPKYLEAGEILLLDGVETALSPTILENLKKDYEAWKGVQKEKRDGVIDNIVSDIFFTDVFMDTNGGKMYDHFGQPVYVQPSNPVLKALLPEGVWKDGTSHVENSTYYNLTKEKWFPKRYTRWDAKDWTEIKVGSEKEVFEMDDDFKQSLSLVIDKKTAELIDKNKSKIERESEEKKVERLDDYRQEAIEDIREEFNKEMRKLVLKSMSEKEMRQAVYNKREEIVTQLRKKYGIETK